jgi:hypothetical protein
MRAATCRMIGRHRMFWVQGTRLVLAVAALAVCDIQRAGAQLSYPIVDTGQVDCYDDAGRVIHPAAGSPFYGQDGQHAGHEPSYTLRGKTVVDNVTGLTWTRSPDWNEDGVINARDKFTWEAALAHAQALNLARYGGHDDWRLPTIKELYSLIQFTGVTGTSAATSRPYLDTHYFKFAYGDAAAGERHIDAQFWSSTAYVGTTMDGSPTAFGVNFADGRIKGYGTAMPGGRVKTEYVYYVRGNPRYGINRLTDNGDGTVSDAATGLMWSQDDSGRGMSWRQALAWVQEKNARRYLGHDDWRLPNAKELESIVDYTRAPDATDPARVGPAIDPVLHTSTITDEGGRADYPYFWTNTTHLDGPPDIRGSAAAYVAFGEALGYMKLPPWSRTYRLLDVHGAGAQRSDPKRGNRAAFPFGRGPQGDVIRIDNYVRLVRDAPDASSEGPAGKKRGPGAKNRKARQHKAPG